MKSRLVLDMPKDCRRCQLMVDRFCYGIPMDEVHDSISINERPSWCPLRPLPQKKEIEFPWLYAEYENGWNDCLDEITGETE